MLMYWLPGLAFGAAIRLRGWVLAGAAPALTYGLVSIGGLLIGKVGLPWTVPTFAAWAAVASVVAFVVSHLVNRRRPAEPEERLPLRDHLVVAAGLAVGLAVGAVTFLRGIGSLDRLSQDWDAPHHGNLVRWLAEHQTSVVSTAGAIGNQPDNTSYFYPSTYHELLALLLDEAGTSLPVLLNLGALSTVLIWPVGIAALGLAWRLPPLAVAFAAAVSTWFSPFPYDSLWRGPLWPYVAGIALIPALLALVKYLVEPRGVTGPVAIAVVVAGMVGLQTSLAVIVFALLLIIFLCCVFRQVPIDWRRAWPTLLATVLLGLVVSVPLILPSLGAASGVTAALWSSEATPAGAFGQMLTFSGVVAFPQWWIGLPALLGIFVMVRRRLMTWMVVVYAVFGVLYAATVSLETPLVHQLTGFFYNDHWRLAALLPLPGSIAFGVFTAAAGGWLVERRRSRIPSSWPTERVAVAASLVVFLLLAAVSGAYVGRNSSRLAQTYGNGPTVSAAEQEAYRWLGERVRPGERVMNDVVDGSAWMYAVAKVEPVVWTFYGTPPDSPQTYLARNLNKVATSPRVREELDELRVRYVIVGRGFVRPERKTAQGLVGLGRTEGFREVFENEGATIYEIEGQEGVVADGEPTPEPNR
ncbi:hypothetical protein GCM10018963_23860 [Saccharothrix longispora]